MMLCTNKPRTKPKRSASICSLLVCAGGALAQNSSSTWTICTRDLSLYETVISDADEDRLVTVDGFGVRTNRPIDSLFFAIPTHKSIEPMPEDLATVAPKETIGVRYLSMIDGQVIKGIVHESDNPDFITMSVYSGSTRRGRSTIALENILALSTQPSVSISDTPPGDAQLDSDTITTHSGDVLRGFVESIAPTTAISSPNNTLRIELAQIDRIELANIPSPIAGIYLSTIDGLSLKVSGFDFDFQHPLTLTIDKESIGLGDGARGIWLMEPDAPAGVRVVDPAVRLVSLSTIEPELIEPTGDRKWTPTPRVRHSPVDPILSSIDLRAPVRVIYPLPKGSSRFACELIAPINTWTDCVASIYSISYTGERTELLSQRLNSDHPSESLNVVLDEQIAKLEFVIDPGKYGAIQDRVLIVHPRVLVETP